MDWLMLAQVWGLLWGIISHSTMALVHLPYALFMNFFRKDSEESQGQCTFYEGKVAHTRRAPVHNSFTYPVRMAVISMDDPPAWFKHQAEDHMTADEARKFAGTSGKVWMLTHPESAGYIQNPISVYYCYDSQDKLDKCIAEVTNTPYGERVSFIFDHHGQEICKAMAVSTIMDMKGEWYIKATEPTDSLALSVLVKRHPQYGDYFDAFLVARKCDKQGRNEFSGFRNLLRYGYEPHRVAFWIYWQAVRLLLRGIPFFGRAGATGEEFRAAAEKKATNPLSGHGVHFVWRDPLKWPWKYCKE